MELGKLLINPLAKIDLFFFFFNNSLEQKRKARRGSNKAELWK